MQFAAVDVNTEIKIGGQSASVANDDFAKLSFYLACVGGCVPGVIEERFTNYQNYRNFSTDTKAQIVVLSAVLEPSLLEGRVFFKTTDAKMEALHQGRSNTFVTATQRQNLTMVNVDREGAIGLNLNNTEIVKIMIYTQKWLNAYYINPLRNINTMLENQRKPQTVYVPVVYTANNNDTNSNYYEMRVSSDNSSGCNSCSGYLLVFVLSVFFSLLGFCCAMCSKSVKNKLWGLVFGVCGLIVNAYLVYTYVYQDVFIYW